MAASFVAMNQVFGPLFEVSVAEAATPDMATERAQALSGQMIIDGHTHFLRDDTRLMGFVKAREAVGKAGWNKALGEQGADHRRSQIHQLHQRDLHGQRHQGGAAVELALGGSRRLVHPAGAGVQDPRAGQQGGRHAADDGAFHDHPGLARLARQGRRGDRDVQARIHGRATPSATTPTRSSPTIPTISTTRS